MGRGKFFTFGQIGQVVFRGIGKEERGGKSFVIKSRGFFERVSDIFDIPSFRASVGAFECA